MGIPKFYRYTSERYPCLSEIIKEYQIPEFDNLYLDMNGIIHNCSHPNDEDVHLRIPEEHIFKDIFRYIDFLFKMIKPCKVFFMAIDGVAPRAKMNQQRGRRFRSARIAEEQEAEAVRKGETLPSEERFDSNCITPGTEFMARLHEQLKYFVQVKVSTDPLWQREGLVIYLSGHNVPGEGEHKIMDFIRHIRSKPDYNPSTRHCLYGLDADLVMLGLSTHELQFSLLREEVKFSRPKKPRKANKRPPPTKQNNGIANYDLTNVSIFTNESNPVTSVDSIMRPPAATFIPAEQKANLVEGKSFANALETLPQLLNTGLELGKGKNRPSGDNDEEDNLVPSPPNEAGAKGVYKAPLPEKTTFLLLHLSLMRDYIDFEFQDLKERLENHPTIKYDLEHIIDDWILMNILVGNDFVPHLPHLHIVKGALPMLYNTYTDVLPTLDGYLNESGVLNLRRFEVFIKKLSQFDIETFRETYDDMKYMESKTGKNIVLGEKMFEDFEFGEQESFAEEALEPMSPELKALAQRTEAEVFGEQVDGTGKLCTDVFRDYEDYFDEGDTPELRLEFLQHKRNYYISKLEFEEISPEFLESFCKEYIRAIQWILLYYYKGVSSWGWFYPFHYAPFASDLRNFGDFSIQFDIGHPFRPFEQLLAVLPAQSRKLLPQCYQWLMTDDKSPIVEFYPEKFEQDLNGKKQDWEAVVLIPFIDEFKLLEVMENEETKLSKEEAHRNAKGAMLCCSYTKEDTGPIKSPRDLFPELESSHVITELLYQVTYNPELLPRGIHPKAERDTIYQGFPTLKSKPITCLIEKADIKVFEFVTREESMVLSLEDVPDNTDNLQALSKKLIGRTVWVNWPHLTFAYVTGVLTREGKFIEGCGEVVRDHKLVESRAEKEFEVLSKGIVQRHLKFKGIKLGDINVIVYAKMMEGRKVRCDASGQVRFETQWSQLEQPFALKTCMYEEKITEIFYLDRNLAKSYTDLYAVGDQVLYLGDKIFGALGTVEGHDEGKSSVIVKFELPSYGTDEFNMKGCVGHSTLKSHDYFNSYTAAGKCQISSYVLSRITGTVFITVEKETKAQRKLVARKAALSKIGGVPLLEDSSSDEDFPPLEMKKVNVGLDLKFNKKNLEVRGYTSKRDGVWFYSGKAVQLVNDYVVKFFPFIDFLGRSEKGKDIFEASDIFPVDPLGKVKEMVEWLEDRGVRDLARIPTNTNLLDDDDIDSVWQYTLKNKRSSHSTVKKLVVKPNLLLKPGLDRGCVPPIPNSEYAMLDRVICVDRGAPIPVGHRGTIIGIQTPQSTEPEQIEESFKSTGVATLMTLIILSDPTPGVFDKAEEFCSTAVDKAEKMTGALASLLGVNKPDPIKKKTVVDLKPRLVKLYPYQVINLSQGPLMMRDNFKNNRQVNNMLASNGVVPRVYSRENNGNSSVQSYSNPRNYVQEKTQQQQQPVRILQRPPVQASAVQPVVQKQTPFYSSKHVQETKANTMGLNQSAPKQKQPHIVPHLIQAKQAHVAAPQTSGSGTLNWPPQPLMSAPVEQFFSAAALAQQKQQPASINNSANLPGTTVQNNPFSQILQRDKGPSVQAPQTGKKSLNGIFSSETAFHPVKVQQATQKNQREGKDILQLLNNASEQYNKSHKSTRSPKKANTQSHSHPQAVAKATDSHQIFQARPPQRIQAPPQQHFQSNQPPPQRMQAPPQQHFQSNQPPRRMPAPPPQWLPRQFFQPPQAFYTHPHGQPLPQHHGPPISVNPFPAAFVPLQVDRNRAINTDSTVHQQQHLGVVSGNMPSSVSLPTATILGPVPNTQSRTLAFQAQKTQEDSNTGRRTERSESRKSRIAANFGNNQL